MRGFPPPSPPMLRVDFATLVASKDLTEDVPVAYTFGGAAPITMQIGNGREFDVCTNASADRGRRFVEFDPYGWAKGL